MHYNLELRNSSSVWIVQRNFSENIIFSVAKTFLKKSVQKFCTFSEQICTTSTFFEEKNPYNPYKKIRTIHTFFWEKFVQSIHLKKKPYNRYNLQKKIRSKRTFKKNKAMFKKTHIKIQLFIHCPLCSCVWVKLL